MPELRWALIGLGVLFIAGLALWEWRRSRRRHAHGATEITPGVVPQGGGENWSRRIEPRIDDLGADRASRTGAQATLDDVPVIHPAGPAEVSLRVAPETAVDAPAAAGHALHEDDEPADGAAAATAMDDDLPPTDDEPDALTASAPQPVGAAQPQDTAPRARAVGPAIRWPPDRADRVLTLRLANPQGALLQGRAVRLALEQAGMVPGPQTIYHRIDAQGCVLASAANMLRPGDLDPAQMDEQQFRGLSLFSVLPGALPPVRMLEELVALARAVAWRLGAVVQDDQGVELDGERLVRLRQSLPDAAEHGTA